MIVEATPPSTVSIGSYLIPIQVVTENGATYAETTLRATIAGSYALKLETSTLLTSIATGGSTTFTAKITDTGYTTITGVKVGVSLPTGWESSISPLQVDSLRRAESSTFTIVVKSSTDTVTGDYLITLTGLSDQVKSDNVQVRFTATASTSWGIIGVGVAGAMLVALLFVFRKFRRR